MKWNIFNANDKATWPEENKLIAFYVDEWPEPLIGNFVALYADGDLLDLVFEHIRFNQDKVLKRNNQILFSGKKGDIKFWTSFNYDPRDWDLSFDLEALPLFAS